MTKKDKIGRNEPCPCGSGKKYKKCCFRRRTSSDSSQQIFNQNLHSYAKDKKRKVKYGETRSIIHTDFKDYKFVAVGNELYYSKEWKTFPDFLFFYIGKMLGEQWFSDELKKTNTEKHPIINWYIGIKKFQENQSKDLNGIYNTQPCGFMASYLYLAYDLYTIRHHTKLQNEMIKRLKHTDQFQGTKYELFATASCIRAGFHDITYEDETDRKRKHPEFETIHKDSNDRISVEAKSRHRPGVLGFSGKPKNYEEFKVDVIKLINKALKKPTELPYVIFIDLNLPSKDKKFFGSSWFKEIVETISKIEESSKENPDKFNLIIFTNHSYHYDELNIASVPESYALLSEYPINTISNNDILLKIYRATTDFYTIPNNFYD